MPRTVDTGVSGGAPNLLGSLTASARVLDANVEWQAYGTSHVPENCGFAFPWQRCAEAAVTAGTPGVNEVQGVTIIAASGGTFTLTFDGFTTAPIAYDASVAAVQAALNALPNVEPGDLVVSGVPGAWVITAGGQYAFTNIPQITIDPTGLVEGEGFDAFTETTTEGLPPGKSFNDGVAAVEFTPFLVEYNAQSCDGIPGDWEALSDRARRGLAVRVSSAIAKALSSSILDELPNENYNLPTLATDITPGGVAEPVACAIRRLIQEAYGCGATGELFIHVPAFLVPVLLQTTLITQVGNVWKLGPHTVVADQGYTNENPVGSVAPVDGEAYIYVSGPIEYATGQAQILEDTTGGVSPRLNRANVIAAQMVIYRFDPCCVYAALAEAC